MNILEIDPQFTSYLREPPRLSYSNPEDPWLSRHLVSSLEVLLGRNRMERIYYRTKNRGLSVQSFFAAALEETQIDVQFDSSKLESIPKTGPLMFVANHPFGVVGHCAMRPRPEGSGGDPYHDQFPFVSG